MSEKVDLKKRQKVVNRNVFILHLSRSINTRTILSESIFFTSFCRFRFQSRRLVVWYVRYRRTVYLLKSLLYSVANRLTDTVQAIIIISSTPDLLM